MQPTSISAVIPAPVYGRRDVLQGIKDFAGDTFKVTYAEGCKLTANHAAGWQVAEAPVLNDEADDSRLTDEAVAVALKSDAVRAVLGENELLRREAWSEARGRPADPNPSAGRNELARAILATGKPVVVLLINGGPLAINYLQEHAPAIIEGWYLGQETGPAVADVIFGNGRASERADRHVSAQCRPDPRTT